MTPSAPVRRLNAAQERLWFLQQLNDRNSVYNEHLCVRLSGTLHMCAFWQALTALTRRHESLRWVIREERGIPAAIVLDRLPPGWLQFIDLQSIAEEPVRDAVYRRAATAVARAPFDLSRGPLIRVLVFRLSSHETALAVVIHHIISDAWSLQILVDDLCATYSAMQQGMPFDCDAADYVRAGHGAGDEAAQLAYWTDRLADPPPPASLPSHRRRPDVRSFAGAKQYFELDDGVTALLRARIREERVTPFIALLALWTAYLGAQAGRRDLMIGTTTSGRRRRETDRLIGFFVNTVVIRAPFSPRDSFREHLREVRAVALDALDHGDAPFEQVVRALALPRVPNRHPLFELMFIYVSTPVARLDLPGIAITLTPGDIAIGLCKYDVVVSFCESGAHMQCVIDYSLELYDPPEIAAHVARFQRFVDRALSEPDRSIRDVMGQSGAATPAPGNPQGATARVQGAA